MPVDGTVAIHIVVVTVEVEAVDTVGTALVGRGTPIVAAHTNVVTRRPVAEARSRKKNTVAIWSGRFVTVYSSLGGLSPSTVID